MTSNVGVRDIKNTASFGFTNTANDDENQNLKNKISEELKRTFNPEFLNRIDDVVFFKQFAQNDAIKIIDLALEELVTKLSERDINIMLTEGAKKFLAEKGFDPLYGARALKRAIQKFIEDPIADEIIQGTFSDGCTIQVKMKNKAELQFSELARKNDLPVK